MEAWIFLKIVFQLFEQLKSMSPRDIQLTYYYVLLGSERESFCSHFLSAFWYNSRSRIASQRWKDYDGQENIIVEIDTSAQLKIFLNDLMVKRIFPSCIIVASSKPFDLLEEEESSLHREIDDHISTIILSVEMISFLLG